jgi:hypothetical protein
MTCNYNIFNTEEEAKAAHDYDFSKFIALRQNNPEYVATTYRWDIPQQHLDGKWSYEVCPYTDRTYYNEPYNADWFPPVEEGF